MQVLGDGLRGEASWDIPDPSSACQSNRDRDPWVPHIAEECWHRVLYWALVWKPIICPKFGLSSVAKMDVGGSTKQLQGIAVVICRYERPRSWLWCPTQPRPAATTLLRYAYFLIFPLLVAKIIQFVIVHATQGNIVSCILMIVVLTVDSQLLPWSSLS
jgi:hypothetical protein